MWKLRNKGLLEGPAEVKLPEDGYKKQPRIELAKQTSLDGLYPMSKALHIMRKSNGSR